LTPTANRDARISGLLLVAATAGLMWAVEVVDIFAGDLDSNGIRPREVDGLVGIALSPFLHSGFGHVLGNTIPFLALGATIALGGAARVLAVGAIVALVGGLGTWLVGPAGTVHVGASGLVFGFAAYLIARGVSSRRLTHLLVGLAVIALFGTTLIVGLVPTAGVSWQGHLFGAVGGIVAARALDGRRKEPELLAASLAETR
jgi:membrane associated rhomboid family serine protease